MVDTTTKMRGIPPRWSVVGSTVDGRRTLCESLALRYGVVHVTADMLFPTSDGSDGTTIRTIQLSRLHAADCAGRGWVLDGFPQTLEQATALVTEDLVPHMVFDLFVDVASEMAAVLHVLTQHPTTTTTTPIPTVVPITPSSESSDTAASSIHRAIDTSIWTSQLHATVPTLATDHPEAVADIAQGTASLPVTDQAAAMHLLTALLQPNSTGLADFAADRGHSVAALLGVYTSLTKATQAVLTSRLPPEVVAMLPFVETLSPNALAAMAPLAQELLHEATSSSIQPATAVKLHTAFFDVLSDKERRQLVRMLPPKEQELVTHVVETTEGMSPRGIETVVHMLLQSTSTPLSVAISTKSVSVSSLSQSCGTDVGPDSQHPEPTYGTIPASDISPPPSRDAMMTKLALTATKAHGRRLLRWVRRAPRSLRVLLFVSSILLALTALVSIVLNLVSGQLVLVVASGWVVFFSLLIVSLEVKISAVEKHNAVAAHFPLVGTVPGRGAFLLFVSMLAMTLAVQATWQNAVLGAAGFLSALVSLWAIALGSLASHQFNVMRTRIESAADLRRLFDTADVDNAQELDIDGLARFCVACDWPIGAVLLESVLRDLDIDNSNTVSFSDLHLWWSQAQLGITSSIRPLSPITNIVPSSHDKPMSVLKLVNIFMGVLTVATGVVGNVAAFHDRRESTTDAKVAVYMILDLWVMVFGLVLVLIEAPRSQTSSWQVLTDCKRFVVDNVATFLGSIFGRSLLHLFTGTFTLSVYQHDSVYLPVVTGSGLVVLSVVNACVGRRAKASFLALAKTVDVSNCAFLFAAADEDGDGVWSLDELDAFCTGQHIRLSAAEWELLVADLDKHHAGVISLHEFTTWVELQHQRMDFV